MEVTLFLLIFNYSIIPCKSIASHAAQGDMKFWLGFFGVTLQIAQFDENLTNSIPFQGTIFFLMSGHQCKHKTKH